MARRTDLPAPFASRWFAPSSTPTPPRDGPPSGGMGSHRPRGGDLSVLTRLFVRSHLRVSLDLRKFISDLTTSLSRTVELRVCYAARQSESYYRTRCLTPSSFGLPPSQSPDLVVTSPDGVKTRGFVLLQPDAAHRPTLLYCHGNGANVVSSTCRYCR